MQSIRLLVAGALVAAAAACTSTVTAPDAAALRAAPPHADQSGTFGGGVGKPHGAEGVKPSPVPPGAS